MINVLEHWWLAWKDLFWGLPFGDSFLPVGSFVVLLMVLGWILKFIMDFGPGGD